MRPGSHSIEKFDPLLRDLVAWELVTRSETGWELVEAAQRRLDQVAQSARPVSEESFVYLDHRCAKCQERRPTRLREGIYVCDSCLAQGQDLSDGAELAAAPAGRRWHLRRVRPREVDPLAG